MNILPRSRAKEVLEERRFPVYSFHPQSKTLRYFKNKVLVIVGPTGIGKTKFALSIAKSLGGEIINADSRQVYQGADIGTGKEVGLLETGEAKKGEGYWLVSGIKLNLYDVRTPNQGYTVAAFKEDATRLIASMTAGQKLPIIVGGTGLYVTSLIHDYQFSPRPDQQEEKSLNKYDFLVIGLTQDRPLLYQKNDDKVDSWLSQGLLQETKTLLDRFPDSRVLQGLIYKQVVKMIKGEITTAEMREKIKYEIHAYIRRQYTWFNKEEKRLLTAGNKLHWFELNDNGQSSAEKLIREWLKD